VTTSADTTGVPAAVLTPSAPAPSRARPDLESEPESIGSRILVGVFVAVPLLAVLAAVPLAWGWGVGWHDIVIAVAFYYV
jgi:stearoyl-CoA desaturase (Delta-9 desaturase)